MHWTAGAAVGDERLVGADSYWDCFGQGFDAVRLGFAGTRFRVAAFTGFHVHPGRRRPDPFDTASNISRLSVQFKTRGEGVLEPYLFRKLSGGTLDVLEDPRRRDVLTPGVRPQRALPHSLDYSIELALQRGHVVADGIFAWAATGNSVGSPSETSSDCAWVWNTTSRLATRTPATGGTAPR